MDIPVGMNLPDMVVGTSVGQRMSLVGTLGHILQLGMDVHTCLVRWLVSVGIQLGSLRRHMAVGTSSSEQHCWQVGSAVGQLGIQLGMVADLALRTVVDMLVAAQQLGLAVVVVRIPVGKQAVVAFHTWLGTGQLPSWVGPSLVAGTLVGMWPGCTAGGR